MTDVNLQLVREFFELNLFRVLTQWQHVQGAPHLGEPGVFLFVENANPGPAQEPEFVLRLGDITAIQRAVVAVRAWHGDRIYASVVEANPVLTQVVEEGALEQARAFYGERDFTTILVISQLPASAEHRGRAIQVLQERGVGHVLEFPTMLQGLLEKVSANNTYAGSVTLQILRILKRYRLIRNQQMEFSFSTEGSALIFTPHIETTVETDDAEE